MWRTGAGASDTAGMYQITRVGYVQRGTGWRDSKTGTSDETVLVLAVSGGSAVPTNFYEARARVAVLTRYRDPNDPELVAARRRMHEEVLVDAITKALAKAPPMTPALCDRVIALLATSEVAA